LKKAGQRQLAPPPKKEGRDNLLDAIKDRKNIALKKVSERKVEEKEEEKGGLSDVMAILARRAAIEADEDSGSDSWEDD